MKLFEKENRYQRYGFEANPFSMVLEPESLKDYIYQRESNRVLKEIKKERILVLRFPEDATISDFTDFYSYLANTFKASPDRSFVSFEVPGPALLNQRLLSIIVVIRNNLYADVSERVYLNYFAEKVISSYESGTFQSQLEGFDHEALYQETLETKGRNLLEIMNYEAEMPKREDFQTDEQYEEKLKEINEFLAKRDSLREFFYRQIEADGFGPAVTSSLRAVIQRGIEEGPSSMIPVNAKADLIGLSKFLSLAYSNVVFTFFNLGNIPFLDEDEIVAYESDIAEAETILKRYARILYLCKVSDTQVVPDVFVGKPEVELNFKTDFINSNEDDTELKNADEFKSLVLYMLGVGNGVSGELLNLFEKLSLEAFEKSSGDLRRSFKLLEKAFDTYVETGNLQEVKI